MKGAQGLWIKWDLMSVNGGVVDTQTMGGLQSMGGRLDGWMTCIHAQLDRRRSRAPGPSEDDKSELIARAYCNLMMAWSS